MTRSRARLTYGLLAGAIALPIIPALTAATATAAGASSAPQTSAAPAANEQLVRAGFVDVRNLPKVPKPSSITPRPDYRPMRTTAPANTGNRMLPPPSPRTSPIVVDQVRRGFAGISEADNSAVNGFALEPPDQGLCVGSVKGKVVVAESVNDAITFTNSGGARLSPVFPIYQLFGVPSTDFLSDPKCYFDTDTGRWFHSILDVRINSHGKVTNAFTALAVSASSDPFAGYYEYRVPALDYANAHCPCFGDQPLIGADRNGFYVSTAEYTIAGAFKPGTIHFNGAQLYAISKSALVAGTASQVIHYRNTTIQSGTMQPATSPMAQYANGNGGTEYLVSGRDTLLPDGRLRPGQVRSLTTWALINTSALNSSSGMPRLLRNNIRTEVYGQPVPATQKAGPRPLGHATGQPLPKLNANDERVNQVVYAAGRLYTGVNTILNPGPRTGIAWFILSPRVSGGMLNTGVHAQGYIAVANNNVLFPSIGVNTAGQGVVAFTLSGPGYYPSAAYQMIDASGTSGPVRISGLGFKPEDGFSCYPAGVCRWGDYSASVAAPNGTIWSGAEYIGNGPRDHFANWQTFVWPVKP